MRAIKNFLGGLILVIIFIEFDKHLNKEKPVSKDKNTIFWAWVCILALAVLGLVNKCAFGQDVPIFYALMPYPVMGQTVCDKNGNLAILVSYNVDDSTEYRRVVSHENVHVGQIRSLGGCVEASRVYRKDPMAQELPAYCAELKERMVSGDAEQVLRTFVVHMHSTYGRGRSVDYVISEVNKVCLGGSNDPP